MLLLLFFKKKFETLLLLNSNTQIIGVNFSIEVIIKYIAMMMKLGLSCWTCSSQLYNK